MAGAMAPGSNKEYVDLLKDWGFEERGFNGGHVIMSLNDREVQLTAPGRSTATPYKALRKAAHIAGVPLQTFMKGPNKVSSTSVTDPIIDITEPPATPVVEPPKVEAPKVEVPEPVKAEVKPEPKEEKVVNRRPFKATVKRQEQVLKYLLD